MSILDQLEQGPKRKPRVCKYVVTRATIDKALAEKIDEILEKIVAGTGEYNSNWLSVTLRKDGIFLNHQTLLRHARKECCCYVN
jgi:hypothetical protein